MKLHYNNFKRGQVFAEVTKVRGLRNVFINKATNVALMLGFGGGVYNVGHSGDPHKTPIEIGDNGFTMTDYQK